MEVFWKTLDQGCSTTLVAALDPALNGKLTLLYSRVGPGPYAFVDNIDICIGTKGLYLVDCQVADPCYWAKDEVAAERLWKLSEEIIGEKFSLGG